MRIVPIITACVVALVLYGIVVERDRLGEFAAAVLPEAATKAPVVAAAETAATPAAAEAPLPEGTVRVIAMKSVAQEIDSAVVLRGVTEAARQVNVQAQTSGIVVSEPLRRGAVEHPPPALHEHLAVPVEPEPAQVLDRLLGRARFDARTVDVFDAEQ